MRIWQIILIVFVVLVLIGLLVFGVILRDMTGFFVSLGIEFLVACIGFFVGRAFELYRLRETLVTEVDRAIDDLSKMRRLNPRDTSQLYFDSRNMEKFCQRFFKILTEQFDYDLGLFEITDASLPFTFFNSYPRKAQVPAPHILDVIKDIALSGEAKVVNYNRDNMAKEFKKRGFELASISLPCQRVVMVPIAHGKQEILGYFALFSAHTKPFLNKITLRNFPEKELLAEIENKKIDDSLKFFIERQRLLLAIGLVRILDVEVFEKIITQEIQDLTDCGRRIVQILTDKLKLPVGFIYLNPELLTATNSVDNPYIYIRDGEGVTEQRIKQEFLSSFIGSRKSDWMREPIMESVAKVSRTNSLHLEFFLSCPIGIESKDYGMIGFLARRAFNEFDKELIRNLENFKIDDCFSALERLKKQAPLVHL